MPEAPLWLWPGHAACRTPSWKHTRLWLLDIHCLWLILSNSILVSENSDVSFNDEYLSLLDEKIRFYFISCHFPYRRVVRRQVSV